MQKYLRSLVLLVIAVCYSGFAPAAGIINFPIDTVRDEIEFSNVTIKYNESFSSVPKSEKIVRPMLLRNQRLSPHTATIRTVAENVPTEVLTCINYARSIWENMLSSDVSLVVNVNYESIENDIETTVIYKSQSGVYVPTHRLMDLLMNIAWAQLQSIQM